MMKTRLRQALIITDHTDKLCL